MHDPEILDVPVPGFQELPFITLEDQFTGPIRLTYTNEPGRGPQLHSQNRPMIQSFLGDGSVCPRQVPPFRFSENFAFLLRPLHQVLSGLHLFLMISSITWKTIMKDSNKAFCLLYRQKAPHHEWLPARRGKRKSPRLKDQKRMCI